METSGRSSDPYRNPVTNGGVSPSYRLQLSASRFMQAPVTAFLEYSGVLRPRPSNLAGSERLRVGEASGGRMEQVAGPTEESSVPSSGGDGEFLIRIVHAGEGFRAGGPGQAQPSTAGGVTTVSDENGLGGDGGSQPPTTAPVDMQNSDGDANLGEDNSRESSYRRFDIQQLARWVEQILPFSLLLLVVFIRQHLQGFFVSIWIAAVMFKSNDILRKQSALKGERKMLVLFGAAIVFIIHIFVIYWWYRHDDLLNPLVLLPPKNIPPFWHAIFVILVNDTMVRQAAMVIKCILLMYYKRNRGRSCRKQGQMLTLVEYFLLLYRALLPAPVWYRFFLNKEYGSLFSSLTTGLYLTFKLTSIVEKVQSFVAALKALSCKEVHYGSYATAEQVIAAGDLCAICQEKMQIPILLQCKHIFCEDCVSEW
ncbi:hypothetical protein AXF42_Ash008893 [Apostasia shenzhenica]|uniref:RING-type domain-containing protein n=1 Tax=Apostasia shenzhenica TaxID=1088818 RepID=A0A2I0ASY6_9ASPA|nr:hypothetical protein AXF42_Ash008893 [Apostasia shenzhenica]